MAEARTDRQTKIELHFATKNKTKFKRSYKESCDTRTSGHRLRKEKTDRQNDVKRCGVRQCGVRQRGVRQHGVKRFGVRQRGVN